MRDSTLIPILFVFLGLFLISWGVGLRDISFLFPMSGSILGIAFFLLAGKYKDTSKNKE